MEEDEMWLELVKEAKEEMLLSGFIPFIAPSHPTWR
jgi:hypothetical protein